MAFFELVQEFLLFVWGFCSRISFRWVQTLCNFSCRFILKYSIC